MKYADDDLLPSGGGAGPLNECHCPAGGAHRRLDRWFATSRPLSMQGREDVSAFIQAFSGSHGYIVDYLAVVSVLVVVFFASLLGLAGA